MGLALDIAAIRSWVYDAGTIGLDYFGHVKPEWKGMADPVTIADREIEQLLSARIRAAYPQHGIIGEEYGAEELDREYLWTIDPIDGTRVYVMGMPTWSITIALLHNFQPVFGLVYMPLYDDWTYTDGDDVICNGVSIRDRLPTHFAPDSHIMTRGDAHSLYDIQFTRVMAYGSTAAHLAYTARGAAVATITHDPYVWDVAAGAAIMLKQGGEVRYESGEPVDFAALDVTKPVPGLSFFGHAHIIDRLIPLVQRREEPVTHPAW
ncbi:MAG: hypothetical protein GXY36_13090 [Chloroflexi bacterium]|nr:hypothetical protein [Chloroflexota bacterium]